MDKHQWTQACEQLLAHLQRSGVTQLPRAHEPLLKTIAAWPLAVAEHSAKLANAPATALPTKAILSTPPEVVVLDMVRDLVREMQPVPPVVAQESSPWGTPLLPVNEREKELAVLNDAVKACRKCADIVCQRKKTVFGIGPRNPRLVMFGEAPGAEEDRKGEPFVGPAGQLLDKILVAAGLSRDSVYIMNSLKCRPPGNRTPSDIEIENCRPFFEQQLEILQPEYIVCWGSIAAKSVLGTSDSIGRLRGRFHVYKQAKVMVTYHPSYLLRMPEAKKLTWEDMKMLMRALEA